MSTKTGTVQILLVEDDDVDAEAVERALQSEKVANPIIRAQNGIEALEMLRGKQEGVVLRQPYLILLDLNMPRMNGIEFLDEIRKDERLTESIVFVLTTSNDERDKVKAYDFHVAGYILKDNAGKEFVDLVSLLNLYWRLVEFPPKP